LRGQYHLDISKYIEGLDPYGGASFNLHAVRVSTPNVESCEKKGLFGKRGFTHFENTTSITLFAGVRYYFEEDFGVFGELGSDGTGYAKIGITKLINKKKTTTNE